MILKNNNPILKKIIFKTIVWLVFTCIVILYFGSAVGLYNSLDTPQYFTTEALIKYGNIDMSPFSEHPHYFVWPDSAVLGDQIVNIRGLIFSVIFIPLHFLGRLLSPYISHSLFPDIITYDGFSYELAITSLFVLVSVLGIFLIYKTIFRITHSTTISILITIVISFGTYAWKYSMMYARQGLQMLLFGLILYCLWRWEDQKEGNRNNMWLIPPSIIWGISFGLDLTLFLGMSIFFFFIILSLLLKGKNLILKKLFLVVALGITITCIITFLHLKFYGTVTYSQYHRYDSFSSIPMEKRQSFILSAPLYPNIITVLFGAWPISQEGLIHFDKYPEVAKAFSREYANKHIFYGVFTITPLFLLGLYGLWYLHYKRKRTYFVFFSLSVFITGFIFYTKTFGFYAANSYDVRYYYPFMLLLAGPTGEAIVQINKKINTNSLKFIYYLLIVLLMCYSLLMGWVGLINTYKPALTGERRIYADIYNLSDTLSQYSKYEIINATLPNRENTHLIIKASFILYILYLIISEKKK